MRIFSHKSEIAEELQLSYLPVVQRHMCGPQALMAFIGDCPDVAMLEDVLIALLDLLRHTPPGRLPLLAGMSGARLFVSLLSREQPALRILGLHLLAHFIPYIQTGRRP